MVETFTLPVLRGLKPEDGMDYDLRYLDDVKNVYFNETGVFEAERLTRTAFGLDVSAQVFVTKMDVYVLTLESGTTSDVLYLWNGNSLKTLVSNIPSASRKKAWSVADFGKYILFTNGVTTLVRNITTGTFTIDNTEIPTSNWICAHRGRLILASPLAGTIGEESRNLISCDSYSNKVYTHNGVTSETISFFSLGANLSGLTVANGNLVSCDTSYNVISVHKKMTSSIDYTIAQPGSDPSGLAFDGINLISCDYTTNKIYVHEGLAATTTSFDAPASQIYGLTVIDGNLISCDANTNLIYVHAGISSTITTSFASPAITPQGLATDGVNLISLCRGGLQVFVHAGVTATTTNEFAVPSSIPTGLTLNTAVYPKFITWSKINELTFQNTTTTDMSNLSGYMPMEYAGDLLRVEPLKQHIIVYGDNGVSALTLAGTKGYAMTTVHPLGIKDAGSVCLNGFADGTTAHYFIDSSGELFVIDANLKVTRLGYKDEISTRHTANAGLIRMSYNVRRDEVLINFYGSGTTLVYGKYGMTTITSDIEALVEKGGTRYVHAPAAIVQDDTYFRTNIIDMGYEGQKYFRGFSANIAIPEAVNVQIKYRTTRTGAWTTTSAVTFDKESGYFNAGMLQGIEFQIIIDASNAAYTNVKIEDIVIRYSKINSGLRR